MFDQKDICKYWSFEIFIFQYWSKIYLITRFYYIIAPNKATQNYLLLLIFNSLIYKDLKVGINSIYAHFNIIIFLLHFGTFHHVPFTVGPDQSHFVCVWCHPKEEAGGATH